MIGKLKGRVDETNEESVILDVGGVGYEVFCPARTLSALPARGEAAELIIETHVREDHIHLYGFANAIERDWFRLLTTVQGVGVRMGIAILGLFSPEQISQAILAQDSAAMKRVSGVGPKLAQRIVSELKDKVLKLPTSGFATNVSALPAAVSGKKDNGISADAVSALVNLGYNRTDAYSAVAQAMTKSKAIAELEELIRLGLKELVR